MDAPVPLLAQHITLLITLNGHPEVAPASDEDSEDELDIGVPQPVHVEDGGDDEVPPAGNEPEFLNHNEPIVIPHLALFFLIVTIVWIFLAVLGGMGNACYGA